MKKLLNVICLCVFLFSCGGSGGSGSGALPPSVPAGTVNGTAHDNVLVGSTITAYQYTNGQRGKILGTAVTDSNGNYSLSVQVETCPILLEATAGYYKEEADNPPYQVNLKTGQVLDAVMNYTTGGTISVQLTPFTHIAAGLAAYRINTGTDVATAIDTSNQDVSTMLGFNVLAVTPLDVTNPLNASAYVSNGLVYGFLSAAISDWTLFASMKVEPSTPHANFNSIALAQLMYADIVADGVLDGKGMDVTGQLVPLSFGVLPLNANVYRYALAAHMIQFANSSPNNATTITGADLQTYAAAYAGYTGVIFGTAAPLPFVNSGVPVISSPTISGLATSPTATPLLAGSWIGNTKTICASVASTGTLDSGSITLNNTPTYISNYETSTEPCWNLDSSIASDGANTLSFSVVDTYGIISSPSFTIAVLIDNTPPTMTAKYAFYSTNNIVIGPGIGLVLTVSDSESGVYSIKNLDNGRNALSLTAYGWPGQWEILSQTAYSTGVQATWTIQVEDYVANCSTYYVKSNPIPSTGSTLLAQVTLLPSGPCQ